PLGPHLGHDLALKDFLAVGAQHTRHQPVLAEGTGTVAHLALVVGELLLQQQGIIPAKGLHGVSRSGSHVLMPRSISLEEFPVRAWWIQNKTLELTTLPTPEPGPEEVRVRVRAIGVNRADILQTQGLYPAPPGFDQRIPGLEYSGEVDAVGERVRGRQV